jgi:hypothetical protein
MYTKLITVKGIQYFVETPIAEKIESIQSTIKELIEAGI